VVPLPIFTAGVEGEGGAVLLTFRKISCVFKSFVCEKSNFFPLAPSALTLLLLRFELGTRSKSVVFECVILVKFGFRLSTYSITSVRPQAFRPGGENEGEGYKARKTEFFPARAFGARVAFLWF